MAKVSVEEKTTYSYTLVLSADEAAAVRAVLGKVTGSVESPVRKSLSAVYKSLGDAGVSSLFVPGEFGTCRYTAPLSKTW